MPVTYAYREGMSTDIHRTVMAEDFRKFDDQGFPIPPRYEDLKFHDDEPGPRPKVSIRAKRWLLVILVVVVVVPVVFGPKLLTLGRSYVAEWLGSQAWQKYSDGNLTGALVDFNEAIEWDPNSRILYLQRAICHEEMNELESSIVDLNKHIELFFSSKMRRRERAERIHELVQSYSQRSWIHVRLGHKEDALSDANLAVDLMSNAVTLNARAYARGVLGVELQEGLIDVETALQQAGEEPSYLDTRGYLLHLLDRNDEALRDMNQALAAIEQQKSTYLRAPVRRFNQRDFERQLQEIDQSLAVMYQHRGLIYQKLGREQEADKDLRNAKDLGYDPAKGVL